jgi:hypothetical protein
MEAAHNAQSSIASYPPMRAMPRYDFVPVAIAAAAIYVLLMPIQFRFSIGGLLMPAFRVFLIPAALYVGAGALKGRFRFAWPDLFMVLATAWIWLATYMVRNDAGAVLEVGGAHTIDIMIAYFLGRMTIRTPRDLRVFLVMIAPGIAFISAVIIQEAVTHVRLLQPAASAITGVPTTLRGDLRMGLLRGAASFPHPILAGIVMSSFLPLYAMSGLRGVPKYLGIFASAGSFFSMSSAAMLGLVMGGVLCVYQWLTERMGNLTWRLFLMGTGILYFVVENTSNRGFYQLLVQYASLNTVSAYNRVLIWKYGTQNIERNPWFGIGYDDWVRPDWMHSGSFDQFWLILALRFGLPMCLFLLAATILAVVMVARRSMNATFVDARLFRGVAISLAVFALGVNSVSLWLSALVWFFMLIGITVSLGTAPSPVARRPYVPSPPYPTVATFPHPRALH